MGRTWERTFCTDWVLTQCILEERKRGLNAPTPGSSVIAGFRNTPGRKSGCPGEAGEGFMATFPGNEAILTTRPPWCAFSNSSASPDTRGNNQPSLTPEAACSPLHKPAWVCPVSPQIQGPELPGSTASGMGAPTPSNQPEVLQGRKMFHVFLTTYFDGGNLIASRVYRSQPKRMSVRLWGTRQKSEAALDTSRHTVCSGTLSSPLNLSSLSQSHLLPSNMHCRHPPHPPHALCHPTMCLDTCRPPQ